jgi:hypothetical protein
MIRTYLIGLFILLTAIGANAFAAKLHLKSWYDFLFGLSDSKAYWAEITIKDGLWLFFLYPMILGLGSFFGNFIYFKFFES